MQRILSGSQWWNRLLPIALLLAGASITAFALAADLLEFGGPQGIGPRQVALALSGFAVFLAGVVLISSVSWRYIAEWLLVVLAAIAVAFVADLLVINCGDRSHLSDPSFNIHVGFSLRDVISSAVPTCMIISTGYLTSCIPK